VTSATSDTLITMPRLSDGMEDGTIIAWLIDESQPVAAGQDLVEIETDKATVVYQAPVGGVLTRLLQEGETAGVGTAIASLDGSANPDLRANAAASDPVSAAGDVEAQPAPVSADDRRGGSRPKASPLARRIAAEAGLNLEDVAGSGRRGQITRGDVESHLAACTRDADRIEASPAARRRAREAGLDFARLTGTGPDGRIRLADVIAHLEESGNDHTGIPAVVHAPPPGNQAPTPEATVVALSRSQTVVARRMAQAKSTIPDFQVSVEIDMEACRQLRASLTELGHDKPVPSYNDMVIKACANALRRHPRVNSSYRDEAVELHASVNVGMAVAAGERLLVVTVNQADALDLQQIAAETRRLASRVRDETITPGELAGATFTVSNLGMLGVDDFTAVINPPQAAILAVGAVAPRAVARGGELAVRATMRATLSADHRVLYGADAAQFLATIRRMLEQPLLLLLAAQSPSGRRP
jgi:pyruvate dehydrogenase E2 component (dihydrolipoamide acetyltransferase)